jgi:hypothetical protein
MRRGVVRRNLGRWGMVVRATRVLVLSKSKFISPQLSPTARAASSVSMDPNSVQAMIDGADNDDSLSLLSYDSCSDDLGSLPTDEAEQEQLMDELDAPRTAELRAPITPGAAESTTLTAERLTEWIEVQRPSLAAPLSTPLHSHPRARSSPAGSGWIHGQRHVSGRPPLHSTPLAPQGSQLTCW